MGATHRSLRPPPKQGSLVIVWRCATLLCDIRLLLRGWGLFEWRGTWSESEGVQRTASAGCPIEGWSRDVNKTINHPRRFIAAVSRDPGIQLEWGYCSDKAAEECRYKGTRGWVTLLLKTMLSYKLSYMNMFRLRNVVQHAVDDGMHHLVQSYR